MVFSILANLVEEKFGIDTWNACLEKVEPESGGLYTAVGTYSDEELFDIVTTLSEMTDIPVPDLIEAYGEYLMPQLVNKYPTFKKEGMHLKEFLLSIEDIIHVEVRKLYPDASLPTFRYEDHQEDTLTMIYQSPRKLCALATGLIKGASKLFEQDIEFEHPKCLHHGDQHCRFELRFLYRQMPWTI